jgi:ankyrin repeat protein
MTDVRLQAELAPLPPVERLVELMMDAARSGRDDVIPALLQAGVDVNARDANGYTPLILASYSGREAATALLLGEGATVDLADGDRGNTALMGVTFKGHDAIAEMLIAAGADVNLRNKSGQTALMMAALFARSAFIDMLLAAGADLSATDNAGNSAASVAAGQGNTTLAEQLEPASHLQS